MKTILRFLILGPILLMFAFLFWLTGDLQSVKACWGALRPKNTPEK